MSRRKTKDPVKIPSAVVSIDLMSARSVFDAEVATVTFAELSHAAAFFRKHGVLPNPRWYRLYSLQLTVGLLDRGEVSETDTKIKQNVFLGNEQFTELFNVISTKLLTAPRDPVQIPTTKNPMADMLSLLDISGRRR